MSAFIRLCLCSGLLLFVAGCASTQMKARKEQRDKAVQTAKLYCDFVNGEVYPDIEVALNLELAKKCDANKSMTITSYRSPSEASGIVYCCSTKDKEEAKKADGKQSPEQKIPDLKLDDGKKAIPELKLDEVKADPKKADKK